MNTNSPEQLNEPSLDLLESDSANFPVSFSKKIKVDLLIDFEAFYCKVQRQLVLKEICFFNPITREYKNYIIETPEYCYTGENESQTKWVSKYLHFIPYSYMNTTYDRFLEVVNITRLMCKKIITKGSEKSSYLQELFKIETINLENYGCPSYRELNSNFQGNRIHCVYHSSQMNYHCSVFKAHLLANFMKNCEIDI